MKFLISRWEGVLGGGNYNFQFRIYHYNYFFLFKVLRYILEQLYIYICLLRKKGAQAPPWCYVSNG